MTRAVAAAKVKIMDHLDQNKSAALKYLFAMARKTTKILLEYNIFVVEMEIYTENKMEGV